MYHTFLTSHCLSFTIQVLPSTSSMVLGTAVNLTAHPHANMSLRCRTRAQFTRALLTTVTWKQGVAPDRLTQTQGVL